MDQKSGRDGCNVLLIGERRCKKRGRFFIERHPVAACGDEPVLQSVLPVQLCSNAGPAGGK